MFIRSERLFLRPIWAEDWADLHAGLSDGEVVRHLARMPGLYTQDGVAPQHDARLPRFLITRPRGIDGVDVLGVIGLTRVGDGVALCYWIARDHWGQGYATEAGRAVLSLARTLGHRVVMARHFLDNPASGRVLRKLGFVPTGGHERLGDSIAAPSQAYRVDLGEPSDCDDDLGGNDGRGRYSSRRAA